MKITVGKLGKGSESDLYRPDTTEKKWRLISETQTEMTIEILD